MTAAGSDIEPYGVLVHINPGGEHLSPARFLTALLEDIARACEAAGASLIGHLKGVLRADGARVYCSLTSLRAGARCRGDSMGRLQEGREVELRLAVLVYGLSATTIDGIVEAALGKALAPTGSSWSKRAFFRAHNL